MKLNGRVVHAAKDCTLYLSLFYTSINLKPLVNIINNMKNSKLQQTKITLPTPPPNL